MPLSAQTTAWGDEGGCARATGQPVNTDMVFILWPDRIERHESSCLITNMQGDVATETIIEVECTGEGETWTTSYGMAVVADVVQIWPLDAPDFISELRLCE